MIDYLWLTYDQKMAGQVRIADTFNKHFYMIIDAHTHINKYRENCLSKALKFYPGYLLYRTNRLIANMRSYFICMSQPDLTHHQKELLY